MLQLTDREWKEFKIEQLFKVKGTKTTKDGIKDRGKHPFISTKSTNNAVNGYTDFSTEKGNCLVAESAVAGFVTYQGFDFTASL